MDEKNIIYISENLQKGFNYGYLLYMPINVKKTVLIAEMNNTGFDTQDYEELYNTSYKRITSSKSANLFKELNAVYLIPLFPRFNEIYTHALSRDTLTTNIEKVKRIDIQFIAMIKDAYNIVKEYNVELEDKFILNGFSASGAFSNRFAIMYPELLKAVISGGQTYAMIPEKELKGIKLTYPIGIYDLEEITGIKFNKEVYFNLPQFIYEGEDSDEKGDTTLYKECMTQEQANIIYTLFGKKSKVKRFANQIKLFNNLNYNNISMKLYENKDHSPQINKVRDFIKSLK